MAIAGTVLLCGAGNPARAWSPGGEAWQTAAAAQETGAGKAAATSVSFEFANPGLTPARWRVEFNANGVGHYHSQPGDASAPDAQGLIAQPFDQEIEISAPVREQIFGIARSHHLFGVTCESRHKVAFTGTKTVRYAGPEGQGSCTFNWSQDAQMMKVADTFEAISMTLEEGRRLRLEYLHDRLALDAELETLATEVKNGNAIELQNIAPELRAIAGDEAVMKRAQSRAAALLAMAPAADERASTQAH